MRQGLDRPGFCAAQDVLAKTGWARSVGGANPYLSLFARTGMDREAIDAEVASGAIHELPSARGCTYVVPSADFPMALTVASSFAGADLRIAKAHLGYSDEEHRSLEDKVLQILKEGPVTPQQLKPRLDDCIRSFGDEGKKRGVTTNLPIALGTLQVKGLIRRIPTGGRLDTQRFSYTISSLKTVDIPPQEAFTMLATRYFSWIGPASVRHFQWFSGLTGSAAKDAVCELGLVQIDPGSDLLCFPNDHDSLNSFVGSNEPRIRLVGSIDNIVHLRRGTTDLLDPEDASRLVLGEKGLVEMNSLVDLPHHGIFDRGRLIGFWEFDPQRQEVVWDCFVPVNESIKAAIAETEAFINDQLGDARSMSLDSAESRRPRIESLRSRSVVTNS